MSKSISVDEETYKIIADFASKDDRPISNAVMRLVKLGVSSQKNMPISQAKEKKEGETLVEVKSYSQLKAERARIEADYAERIGFCQDTDSIRALYAEMNRELAPIDNQINAIFNKEEK